MKKNHPTMVISFVIMIAVFFMNGFLTGYLPAQETKAVTDVKPVLQKIENWLLLGPAGISTQEEALLKTNSAILDFNYLKVAELLPVEGETVLWNKSTTLKWKTMKPGDTKTDKLSIYYLATYLEVSRWLQTKLSIDKSDLEIQVYLDGNKVNTTTADNKINCDLTLSINKHLLVLKVLIPKEVKSNPDMVASLENKDAFKTEIIAQSLDPMHKANEENIVNTIVVTGISVAPDAKLAAVSLMQTEKNTGTIKTWMEILNTTTGAIVYSTPEFKGIRGFQWMGSSEKFSFTVSDKEDTSLYSFNLTTQSRELILEKIKNFSSYEWSRDGSFLVYSTFKQEDDKETYKYYKEIDDKQRDPAAKYSFYIYYPASGTLHQLSDPTQDYNTFSISPDGKSLLLTQTYSDYKHRPYVLQKFSLYDIETGTITPILEGNFVNFAQWGFDSKKIIVIGGPSAFNGLGINMKDPKMIPNDYDVQAYLYDLTTKTADPITKYFDPSIDSAYWDTNPGIIYFRATDKSDQGIFAYSLKDKKYKRFSTIIEVVSSMDIALKKDFAVYWGSGPVTPYKLYKLDLITGKASVLKDYNGQFFKYTKLGTCEDWNFTMPNGKTIYGHIHYPADFDKTKKYPCIVYYYGGTHPITKDFGGKYAKDWWTAKGYVVYIPQPSGAIGYGQDFSAIHVNDWGKTTSQEIIFGVKEFLKTHPFVDPEKVGAMGASYGGFLTQYLATQTDMFAGFISHAGITTLSSYWGVGDWGYTYSGIATADYFPWNQKQFYLEHSPLFMADQIKRPLLLLHGDSDNNVPTGESYQMYAALKLLGKEVELVTYKGEAHGIQEYKNRLHWMRLIVAWWDKQLKKQPESFSYILEKK